MDAQTQQLLAQMQQQLQTQQQQLQQQQAQQQQLHTQLIAAQAAAVPAAAASAVAVRSIVKPKPPSTFAAADKVGKLDQWEREMRYQFAAYGAPLASDAARVSFAVSYLGAVPLQWWDANPAHRSVHTWDEFVALLQARFRPVNAARQARTELFKIKQKLNQTAGAFAACFQELLVSLPDMHVDDQVYLFVRGLLPALKRRVGDKEFATLSAAINAAVQSEGLYGTQLADEPQLPSGSGEEMDLNALEKTLGPARSLSAADVVGYGRMAAQVNELQEQLFAMRYGSGGDRITGLSRRQLEDRMQAGQCLRCGSKGHFKADCPQSQ